MYNSPGCRTLWFNSQTNSPSNSSGNSQSNSSPYSPANKSTPRTLLCNNKETGVPVYSGVSKTSDLVSNVGCIQDSYRVFSGDQNAMGILTVISEPWNIDIYKGVIY